MSDEKTNPAIQTYVWRCPLCDAGTTSYTHRGMEYWREAHYKNEHRMLTVNPHDWNLTDADKDFLKKAMICAG